MKKQRILLIGFVFVLLIVFVQGSFASPFFQQDTNQQNSEIQEVKNSNNNSQGQIVEEQNSDDGQVQQNDVSAEAPSEEIPVEVINGVSLNYFLVGVITIGIFAFIAFFFFLFWMKRNPTASKMKINRAILLIGALGFLIGYIVDVLLVKIFESMEFLKLEMLEYIKEYYYNILLDGYPGITFGNSIGFIHFVNMLILFIVIYSIIFGIFIYISNKS